MGMLDGGSKVDENTRGQRMRAMMRRGAVLGVLPSCAGYQDNERHQRRYDGGPSRSGGVVVPHNVPTVAADVASVSCRLIRRHVVIAPRQPRVGSIAAGWSVEMNAPESC